VISVQPPLTILHSNDVNFMLTDMHYQADFFLSGARFSALIRSSSTTVTNNSIDTKNVSLYCVDHRSDVVDLSTEYFLNMLPITSVTEGSCPFSSTIENAIANNLQSLEPACFYSCSSAVHRNKIIYEEPLQQITG